METIRSAIKFSFDDDLVFYTSNTLKRTTRYTKDVVNSYKTYITNNVSALLLNTERKGEAFLKVPDYLFRLFH